MRVYVYSICIIIKIVKRQSWTSQTPKIQCNLMQFDSFQDGACTSYLPEAWIMWLPIQRVARNCFDLDRWVSYVTWRTRVKHVWTENWELGSYSQIAFDEAAWQCWLMQPSSLCHAAMKLSDIWCASNFSGLRYHDPGCCQCKGLGFVPSISRIWA